MENQINTNMNDVLKHIFCSYILTLNYNKNYISFQQYSDSFFTNEDKIIKIEYNPILQTFLNIGKIHNSKDEQKMRSYLPKIENLYSIKVFLTMYNINYCENMYVYEFLKNNS